MGFPDSSVGKESVCNGGEAGLIPRLGRSTGDGIGYPLQYSGLENSMECLVHGIRKSRTRLRDFHFHVKTDTQGKCHVTIKDSSDYKPRNGKDFQQATKNYERQGKIPLKFPE